MKQIRIIGGIFARPFSAISLWGKISKESILSMPTQRKSDGKNKIGLLKNKQRTGWIAGESEHFPSLRHRGYHPRQPGRYQCPGYVWPDVFINSLVLSTAYSGSTHESY